MITEYGVKLIPIKIIMGAMKTFLSKEKAEREPMHTKVINTKSQNFDLTFKVIRILTVVHIVV